MTLKVWNLWELMKEFNSNSFFMIFSNLYAMEAQLRLKDPSKPNDEDFTVVSRTLQIAEELCKEVNLPGAYAKIVMTNLHLRENKEDVTYASLTADIRHVLDMVVHDMFNRKFIEVSPDYDGFLNNDDLFGKAVAEAFPSAKEDIREAGNCLATEAGTAAVFHLMRAVEWGLRALCLHLGVTRVRRSNRPGDQKYVAIPWAQWERILDEAQKKIDKKIERLGPGKKKQDLQQFYYPLMQDLKGFKDAFRNHVMHGRESFSLKRASDIHDYVERFMQSLATRVSE